MIQGLENLEDNLMMKKEVYIAKDIAKDTLDVVVSGSKERSEFKNDYWARRSKLHAFRYLSSTLTEYVTSLVQHVL